MRDILITAIVFGLLPFVLSRPYIGILLWSWLGYMNPHRLAWGFAYDMPFAQITAITLLIGLFFSQEPKKMIWNAAITILLLFIIWMNITTLFALNPTEAWPQYQKVMKIQIVIFLTLLLINTKEKLHYLLWIITFSIAFFGIKGGVYTIDQGGGGRVFGPPGGFIAGNNEIALALTMVLPLMYYLRTTVQQVWLKNLFIVFMLLTTISILGSYSRGAFLGLFAMGFFLWLKTKTKLITGMLLLLLMPPIFMFMPQKWYDRIGTIQDYKKDNSAMGRINAWHFAFNLAKEHPLVGGGFETFRSQIFYIYAPDPNDVHDAHSIYFEVLGEHGFVGLSLFLLLCLFTWLTARSIIKMTRGDPEFEWANTLARMIQVSFIAYGVGGAFLGLAYFDLPYHLLTILVITQHIITEKRNKAKSMVQTQSSPLEKSIFQ